MKRFFSLGVDPSYGPMRLFGRGRSAPERNWSRGHRWLTVLLCGATLHLSACAGHSAKTQEARAALDAGQPRKALDLYNDALDVKNESGLPETVGGDNALLILDRSMIYQQLNMYQPSSRDLQIADKEIEMLDLRRTAIDDIGKYMFSDDVGPYQAPPYEKLMVNTMNMLNYLARHDLSGARVEARRFTVMEKYLREQDSTAASMIAPGSYFAGFAFEKSGQPGVALRYYEDALSYGEFTSLVEPIRRLSGGNPSGARSKALLAKHPVATAQPEPDGDAGARPEANADTGGGARPAVEAEGPAEGQRGAEPEAGSGAQPTADSDEPAELLVVINYGRVPAKVAKRIPIGLALTFATVYLSPRMTMQANRVAAQGLVTWINYPELEETERSYTTPSVKVNGEYRTLEGALSVTDEAREAYDEIKGRIIASAITRTVTRAIAGNAAGAAARDNAVGMLISLGTQAALTAADTPDTRSWATLPGRVAVARIPLEAGTHRVSVQAQHISRDFTVKLENGGWEALVLTVLR